MSLKMLETRFSVRRICGYRFGPPKPTHCAVCERVLITTYQRVRHGAYIFPEQERGAELEYVCNICFESNYGFIYVMTCCECGATHNRNQRCDGVYTTYAGCETCATTTRHVRGAHAADTSRMNPRFPR